MATKEKAEKDTKDKKLDDILYQIRLIKMLLTMDVLKDMTKEEKINKLFEFGFNQKDIVNLIGSSPESLGIREKMKSYQKFAILREKNFLNKQIAELFGTSESNVKSTISQHKKEIERFLNERTKK